MHPDFNLPHSGSNTLMRSSRSSVVGLSMRLLQYSCCFLGLLGARAYLEAQCCVPPTSPSQQQCQETCGNSGQTANPCEYNSNGGCPSGDIPTNGCCCAASPIVVDAYGEGFHLTSNAEGVSFRVLPDEAQFHLSWLDNKWHNGWLALDRNGNGSIDDFTELFGNFTSQTPDRDRNGYRALAVFDAVENGGNGNGFIDPGDSVYKHLLVWIDANHDGISQPEELHPLRELGIFRIDLKYSRSTYTDTNGNNFRYKADIWDKAGRAHEICYDVFLVSTPESSK